MVNKKDGHQYIAKIQSAHPHTGIGLGSISA